MEQTASLASPVLGLQVRATMPSVLLVWILGVRLGSLRLYSKHFPGSAISPVLSLDFNETTTMAPNGLACILWEQRPILIALSRQWPRALSW